MRRREQRSGHRSLGQKIRAFLDSWWRSDAATGSHGRHLRTFLTLEQLQDRICPTTLTWTGQGGDALWSDAANWTGGGQGAIPTTAGVTDLLFPGSVTQNTSTDNDLTGVILNSITFDNSGTAAYQITDQPFTVNVSIAASSAGSDTLAANILGLGSVSENGGGTLILTGTNAYLGNTTLTSGTLTVGDNSALGSGTLDLNGGTLNASAAVNLLNPFSVAGAATIGGSNSIALSGAGSLSGSNTLTVTSTGTTTFGGGLGGTGNLTVNAATGSVSMPLSDNYSGITTLTSGTLTVGSSGALGTGNLDLNGGTLEASATVTLGNAFTVGGAATIGGSNNITFSGPGTVAAGNTLTVTSTGTTTFSGGLGGGGNLTVNAATGTVALTTSGTLSGTTTLTTGTLSVGHNTALGTSTLDLNGGTLQASAATTLGNAFAVGGGATIGGSNNLTLSGAGTLSSGDTLTVTNSATTTFSGGLSGAGMLTVNTAAGTVSLPSSDSFSGLTTLTSGTLSLGSNTSLGTGDFNFNGGTLQATSTLIVANVFEVGLGASATIGGSNSITFSGGGTLALGITGSLTVTNSATTTFSGGLTGAGTLTIDTSGTVSLPSADSYSGTTTLTLGTLSVGNGSALGVSSVNLNGGTLQATAAVTLGNSFTVGGGATVAGTNDINFTGGGTLTGGDTLTVTNTATTTFSGGLSGGGNLTVNTTGTVAVSATGSYSGTTTLTAGTLSVSATNALGTSALDLNGGTLKAGAAATLGNTITVGGAATIGGTNNLTLTGPVSLTGTNSLTLSNTATTTFNGAISGGGGLTMPATAGTVVLGAANNYIGQTAVNGGTLQIGNAAAVAGSSSVVAASGARVDVEANNAQLANVVINAGAFLRLSSTLDTTQGATVPTAPVAGTLEINNAAVGANFNGLMLANGSTVTALAAGATYASSLTLAGAKVNFDTSGTGGSFTISGVITDNGSAFGIIKIGANTLTLNAANTYSGATVINAGTLAAGTNTAFGTGTIDLNAGTLAASTAVSLANPVSLGGAGTIGGSNSITLSGNVALGSNTLLVTNSATTTFSGGIGGTGGLTVNATVNNVVGTVSLPVADTYSGVTTLLSGLLSLKDPGALGTNTLLLNGGTLQAATTLTVANSFKVGGAAIIGGTNDLTLNGAGSLLGSNTLTVTNSGRTTFQGPIGGSGNLTVNTSGTVDLEASSSYSGTTTLTTGTLMVGGNSALGTSVLNLNGGTLETDDAIVVNAHNTITLGNVFTVGGAVEIGGSNVVFLSGLALSGAGTLSGSSTLTVINTGNTTFSGGLGGTGNLTENTTGTLAVTAPGTYTGTTTLTAGTLIVGSSNALGTGTLNLNGGVIEANAVASLGNAFTVGGAVTVAGSNSLTLSGAGTLAGNNTLTVINTATTTFSGGLGGSGNLTENTSGTLALTAAGTYSGTTTLTAGTLSVGNNTALGTSALDLNGGTLEASTATTLANTFAVGGNASIGGTTNLTLTGTGTLSSNDTLTVSNSGTTTFNGSLGGGGSLTVNAGTVVLANVDTYTGLTAVDGGTLQLTSSAAVAGDVQVNSGGTLTGLGTVSGTLTTTGGTVAPGLVPGLTAGNVRLGLVVPGQAGTSSSFQVTLNSDSAYSQSQTSGTIALGGNLQVSLGQNYIPAVGTQFTIINNTGTSSVTGNFAGLPTSGSLFSVNFVTFEILYNGGANSNSVVLKVHSLAPFGVAPLQLTPSGSITTLTPTFTWSATPGADHYQLWLTDLTAGKSPLFPLQSVSGTSFTFSTNLTRGHSYVWYVQAIDSSGNMGQWSNGLDFSIASLAVPSQIAPSGPVIGTQTPTFTWNAVAGAASYMIWVDNLTTGQSKVVFTSVSGTSFTPTTPLPYDDMYEWWVEGVDGNNSGGPWSSGLQFSLAPLGTPTLIGPDGAANTSVTFTWNAVSGADHYDLWVNDLTTSQQQVVRATNVTTTSFTTTLTLNHTYNWYVAADTSTGLEGFWSTPLTFTVVASPVPLAPRDEAVSISGQPTFSWNSLSGAVSYELWLADTTTGKSPVFDVNNISGTSYTPTTALTFGDSYRWYVRANLNTGTSPWSSPTSFTLAPFDDPDLTAPSGTITTQAPTFTWTAISGADHYEIFVKDITTGQSPVIDQQVQGTSFTPGTPLTIGDSYHWWVRAQTSTNVSGFWSDTGSFTIQQLAAPTLVAPSGEQTGQEPTFTWSAVTGADHYELYVQDTTLGQKALDVVNVQGTTFTATSPLTLGDNYTWYVRAFTSSGGAGVWSGPLSFSLAALPAPLLYLPAGNITNRLPTFTWSAVAGADHYEIWVGDVTTGQTPVLHSGSVSGTSFTAGTALVKGDEYIWWVRAITNTGADGFWSNPLEFTEV